MFKCLQLSHTFVFVLWSAQIRVQIKTTFSPPCSLFVEQTGDLFFNFPQTGLCWMHPHSAISCVSLFLVSSDVLVKSRGLIPFRIKFQTGTFSKWWCVSLLGGTQCFESVLCGKAIIDNHCLVHYSLEAAKLWDSITPFSYTS